MSSSAGTVQNNESLASFALSYLFLNEKVHSAAQKQFAKFCYSLFPPSKEDS
jgi:hypothetical protein